MRLDDGLQAKGTRLLMGEEAAARRRVLDYLHPNG